MADSAAAFMEVTGADQATAEQMMAASGNDLQAAVALFYAAETGGAAEPPADSDSMEAEPSAPSLPQGDLVADILSNARNETDERAETQPWAGAGRTLGSQPDAAGVPLDPPAPAGEPPELRHNAKRVRIIFWADGFTVEDLSAEEAEAAAAQPAAPAARKTGIQTLGDRRAADAASPKMALPDLRKYEDNKQFMVDLKNGLPPSEFREIDLSSGTPVRRRSRPRVGAAGRGHGHFVFGSGAGWPFCFLVRRGLLVFADRAWPVCVRRRMCPCYFRLWSVD